MQLLAERYRYPAGVTILDGGTLGLDLLPRLEGVERLLVVDAVETGQPAGALVRMTGEEVPVVLETKVSPHQMGLKDLLAGAMLQGFAPREMVLWGVQPALIELGTDLSEAVAARLEPLVGKVLAELTRWDVPVVPA